MEKLKLDYKEVVYDKCVVCNTETEEPRNKHITLRYNYIEGVGQLCKDCGLKFNK